VEAAYWCHGAVRREYQLLNWPESVDIFNPDAQRVYGSTQEK
jgi:hypothetical protein